MLLATPITYAVEVRVPGTSNPYLAGMPAGTPASRGDIAPAQSPALVSGVVISPGTRFAVITALGNVNNDPPLGGPGPDGAQPIAHADGAEWSKSDITAPINCLLGVFLADGVPTGTAPAGLDFSTQQSREYTLIEPQVNQIFFIGDGKTSAGVQQMFRAPVGATRLFLATMDGQGWYNNSGRFDVTISAVGPMTLQGRIELADFTGDLTAQPITLEIRAMGSLVPLLVRTVNLTSDGHYQFVISNPQVVTGNYDLAAKGSHWLKRVVHNQFISEQGSNFVDFDQERALTNGDIDGDNEVSIGDYSVLSAAYGSTVGAPGWTATADLDGDSEVSIGDYAVLSANYGFVGDQ